MTNIRDIARLAGVSVATVSRALAKPEVVRPATIKKVKQAITQLGYSPNLVASSLRRQRSDTIIVVVPDIHNPFYSGVVQGIENIAHDNGYKILLGETQNNQERLDHYTAMLTSKGADGLILLGSRLPTIVQDSLAEDREPPIPLVLACERFDGLSSPSVEIDNVAASRLATEHLIELGHRRIATISGPKDNPLSGDRLQGYRAALKAAHIRFDRNLVVEGDFSIRSGYAAMTRLMAQDVRPTALFCANDEMAIGAQKAAREAGLKLPADLAMAGFDDIRFAEYAEPPLTTIAQPTVEIGEVAMRLMMGVLNGTAARGARIILPHELIKRASSGLASTACPGKREAGKKAS
ncbi:MAG TPA: LacI family DNA-binding transcriptional regulator [Novosphingobium sp.]|nr:LacI family DNA-binding transcriptional regulator [Novosphingobium sp.]